MRKNNLQVSFRLAPGALLLILFTATTAFSQVAITPSTPPVVNQGTSVVFSANTPVTWSCPGCAGTIDADGTYHAPATVKAQQSYGGFQVLPNNHIFNTRIDSLPLNSNSAQWIAGAGAIPFSYEISFPINYVNGATPVVNEIFEYTPGNNGGFQIPALPALRVECGAMVHLSEGCDRHALAIDTTSGTFQEIYNLVPLGTYPNCPSPGISTCTAASGVRYSNTTYDLPNVQGGSVDAAGLYVIPLTLRLQELQQAVANGGTIKHALRMTLQNGYIKFNSYVWPATATASAGGGVVPYGARFRLKSGFSISSFSPIAQILLTQLKQYGLILADGGTGWATQPEYTRWPAAYRAAFSEISGAAIAPTNFEAVDESGLEVAPNSGLTTTAETVVATSIANPAVSAKQQVVLVGVTVTLPKDTVNIQAGSAAQQIYALINGSANRGANWSMNPAIGNLTAGGVYTPPASIAAATSTTITATSGADPTVAASITVTVFPAGTIYLVLGQTNPYTDTGGNIWQAGVGDDGCHRYDNGGTWPNTPDITVYKIACFSENDIRFDFTVPNGTYQITAKFAETEAVAAGYRLMNLEAQGATGYPNVDIVSAAGGVNKPVDFTMPATVNSGSLSFVVRHIAGDFALISALKIVPLSLAGGSTSGPPPPPGGVQVLGRQ